MKLNDAVKIDHASILNCLKQYVYVKDENGFYIYANQAFIALTGLTSEEIIGKTDFDLMWRHQADFFRNDDNGVLQGIPLLNVERYQTRANGLIKIMLNLVPYRSPNGEVIGVLGSFFDCNQHLISEEKGIFDNNKLYLEFVPEWLSAAEVRVCFYLLHGFSTAKISEKTGTTMSTIRYHLENIKNKMQCKNKSEITEVAMRTGIAWKIFSLQHHIAE